MMREVEEAAIAADIHQDTKETEKETIVDFSNTSQKLAEGLLATYKQPLEHVKQELQDVISKQDTCITHIQNENKKLSEVLEDVELDEMFANIETYQRKLKAVKKEILCIHERMFKLKKRALRLQQIKQKEALSREQQREQELRREEQLIGKPKET